MQSRMTKKVIIPAAGLGTRLLPTTKEQPKEMMPIFAVDSSGNICVKPLLQLLFEQLYGLGFRDFCIIVGRGKRAIEDHFTPDINFITQLNNKGKGGKTTSDLQAFYNMVKSSSIIWINQPEPKGFGHAVLMAKPFVGDEPFLVCAGDTYIISHGGEHIRRLIEAHIRYGADATLILQHVKRPKGYGIAEANEVALGVFKVERVVEKPERPPSNLAIMPIYAFNPIIMEALEKAVPGYGGEIQLTDGIQRLIDMNLNVYAVKLKEDEVRLDIGTPETYWEALRLSYKHFKGETHARRRRKERY